MVGPASPLTVRGASPLRTPTREAWRNESHKACRGMRGYKNRSLAPQYFGLIPGGGAMTLMTAREGAFADTHFYEHTRADAL